MNRYTRLNNMSKYIICFFFCQNLFCQNAIKIIQSDQLDQLTINDTVFQKFSGNVIIEYQDFTINCDNILMDQNKESVTGWGKAHVFNDTIRCKTDSLTIKQFENIIFLYKNTVITTNQIQIDSDQVQYNYENNELRYFNGGIVSTENYKITSQNLIHQIENELSKFQNFVILETDNYKILTKELTHKDQIIDFVGETSIENSKFLIHCEKGLFKKNDIFKIYNQKTIDSYNREIQSDTLFIDLKNDENYFKNNVEIMINPDTYIIAEYVKQNDQFSYIYDDSYIKLLNKSDSILISGDTIKIHDQEEKLEIINNIIIEGKELEGSCQNMQFKNQYKYIYMYSNPVLWVHDTQITGDEIELYVKANQLDSIHIPSNPFVISPCEASDNYNQIKGKFLSGKFEDEQIEYVKVMGNSKMKYFEQQKPESSIIGLNNIESGSLRLLFDKNSVKQVISINQIESDYIELDMKNHTKKTKELLYFNDFELINRLFIQNKSTINDTPLTD